MTDRAMPPRDGRPSFIHDLVEHCGLELERVDLGVEDLVIEHVGLGGSPDEIHHQVFRGGYLTAWRLGPAPDPDLRLTGPPNDMGLLGTAFPRVLTGLRAESLDRTLAPLPPIDEIPEEVPHAVPIEVPGADLELWIDMPGAPLPGGGLGLVFRSGRAIRGTLDSASLQEGSADPVYVVSMRYARYLEYRLGHISVSEALMRRPPGSWAHQMLAAGLYDGPEHRAERDRRALGSEALTAWRTFTAVLAHPAYRSVLSGGRA